MAFGGKGQRGQSQGGQLSGHRLTLFFNQPGDSMLTCEVAEA